MLSDEDHKWAMQHHEGLKRRFSEKYAPSYAKTLKHSDECTSDCEEWC